MTAESLILAAAMIPLASALATAAFGERLSRRTVVAFSLGTTVSTLAAGVALLWTLNISGTPHGVAPLGVWLELSHLKLVLSLRAQPSDVAVLVWTTSVVLVGQIAVAFRQQKRLHRSCAGLSLLGASVHWVILGDSMLLVFLGLQTFALATYLLLGFRFLSVERARTAQKTFIVHRIGAISFFLAMVILLHTSKTLELSSLAVALQGLGGGVVLDVASILVLLAGAALAAQLPLSTWLASASTGASRTWGAIHALALVAGVGVVRRLWPLVGQSETALLCLASVGTLSAFLFSTSASAQSDARRSLALAGGGFGGLAFAQCATRGVSSALFYAMAQG
ncbi:MAG: proton-conducting transporter membrane subunit [Myxococcota bacterium]